MRFGALRSARRHEPYEPHEPDEPDEPTNFTNPTTYNAGMDRLICAVLLVWWSVQVSAQARKPIEDYVAAHQQPIVTEFVELLSIPNVAADRANVKRNADLLRTLFLKRGFAVEILPTDGNPLVFAELAVPGARRTILFYAHYDGQPIDPKAWSQTSPFTPVVRTGRLEDGAKEIPDFVSLMLDVHVDAEVRPPSTGAWQLPPTPYKEPVFGKRYLPDVAPAK